MSYKSTHTGAQIDAGVSAALNPDATPTPSSTNLVTSGGVADELSKKQDALVFDNAPTSGSNNPVKSGGIYTALADKASNGDLARKAPLDSPTFTGTPTAPTPTAGDDSTKVATTAFVRSEIVTESAALEQMILANAENLAPAFDPDTPYVVGEYVLYSGKVYRFKAAHTGAWDAGDVEQTTLGEEVEALDAAKANKTDVATADAALEQMILASFPTDTITNVSVASFADGADGIPVKALTVNITPVQAAGTPTPESPLPISGWTGAKVSDTAKNLFDSSTAENGYVTSSGEINTDDTGRHSPLIPVNAGETYTFSGYANAYTASRRFHAYDANGNWLAQLAARTDSTINQWYALTAEIPAGARYVRLSWRREDTNIMLERGASRTAYQTFGTTYPVSWQTEAGTVYGGTLTDNGDGTWTLTVTHGYIASYAGESINEPWISSEDVYSAGTTPTTGAQVIYPLTTPVNYDLTADSVKTLLGQNNVFCDAGDIAALTYRADPTLYIDKKIGDAIGGSY